MVEPTVEFIGKRLDAIQTDLRELKFSFDVERRNRDAEYRNLVTELGAALGTFDAKFSNRLEAMSQALARIEKKLGIVEEED